MTIIKEYIHTIDTLKKCFECLDDPSPDCDGMSGITQQTIKKFTRLDSKIKFDSSNLSRQNLDTLLKLESTIERQFETLKKNGGFSQWSAASLEAAEAAIERIKARGVSIAHEKTERMKRELICILAETQETQPTDQEAIQILDRMLLYVTPHFHDERFAFYFMSLLAEDHSHYLCKNLDRFPRLNEETLLSIAFLIKSSEARIEFCQHFHLDPDKFALAMLEAEQTKKNAVHTTLREGICHGYTLSRISHIVSQRPDLFPIARFIQAVHELAFSFPKKNTLQVGTILLESFPAYPRVMTRLKNLLQMSSTDNFVPLDRTETARFEHLAGIVSLKILRELEERERNLTTDLCSVKKECFRVSESIETSGASQDQLVFLKSEKERLTLQWETIYSELADFEKELISLKHLWRSDQPMSTVPPAILKNTLKLEMLPLVHQQKPIHELPFLLKTSLAERGHYELTFYSTGEAHSIHISSNPLSYCDPNDTDCITGIPQERTGFRTVGEMVDSLELLRNFLYQDRWETFSLTPYQNLRGCFE